MSYRIVRELNEHPIPYDQEEINDIWRRLGHTDVEDAPCVDEAHDKWVHEIASWGEWRVFRPMYPFGHGGIVFWNGASGEAFKINDDEGSWHHMINLFAEIVESEGDCRDAEYSNSLMPSGSYDQRCRECGSSWYVG